ncbi:MAG: cupin domain-containing protein [Alphaproteobacteria bacterium]|nr:cupin domain-containing protein [Alphaproteobacteria bacterium]
MDQSTDTTVDLEKYREVKPELIDLRTQLISSGMTRELKAKGDHSTFRIHVYASGLGEDHGMHAHIEEEHLFIVLQGRAQFVGLDGKLPELGRNQGIFLPKGCFYEFYNPGEEPLVILRFGAAAELMLSGSRLTPDGRPIAGRGSQRPEIRKPTFIEGAFFE